MKLTAIISDEGSAIHVGGPVTYRRVTVDLTPEQEAALVLRHGYETHGLTFIEKDPPPSGSDDADRSTEGGG